MVVVSFTATSTTIKSRLAAGDYRLYMSSITSDVNMNKDKLKQDLYRLCAMTDRGFAANPTDRNEIMGIVEKLKESSIGTDCTYGLSPRNDVTDESKELLFGVWTMLYTTAFDVLSLNLSPFTVVNGIYQIIERDGNSANIIDLSPRIQSILPANIVGNGSVLRLKVITKSFSKSTTRVGLDFKSLEVKPLTLFNIPISLPFDIKATLPQSLLFPDKDGVSTSPGYFDVIYLDNDLLIIKQNNVDGYFVHSKRCELEPSSFY